MLDQYDKKSSREDAMASFDAEIGHQEDLVYGIALFFECLSVVHANQPAVVETYRKQFRNLIQKGRERIADAVLLRNTARQSASKTAALVEFDFEFCRGYSSPADLAKRAETLVETYKRVFPGRPRSKEFSTDETLVLIEEASELVKS